MLGDVEIAREMRMGDLRVYPVELGQLQPASIDLRIGGKLLDPATGIAAKLPALLHPGQFRLGCTIETLELPDYLAARFEGRSSLGRIGLMTHVTAGFIDPGFRGQLTVELHNVSSEPIELVEGGAIGQLCFYRIEGRVARPYGSATLGSRYQGQRGATPARAKGLRAV